MNCQNPKLITSANNAVTQFGFDTIFKPSSGEILFDIANTIITNNSITNGISFEVTSPSGQVLGAINFPSVDINTTLPTNNTYTLGGFGVDNDFFGTYKVKASFLNGAETYTIEQLVEVCKPDNLNAKNFIIGKIDDNVDCVNAQLVVKDSSKYVFQNQQPISKVYSVGITAPSTPIQVVSHLPYIYDLNGKTTGRYDIDILTKAKYDIKCGNYLEVEYRSSIQKDIQCSNKICDLICCWTESKEIAEGGGVNGANMAKKMESVYDSYIGAIGKAMCGKDVSKEVQEIRDTLGCECKCSNQTGIIQKNPIVTNLASTQLIQSCGTRITNNPDGTTTIHSFKYSFKKCNAGDLAFNIKKNIIGDCEIEYCLEINYDVFAQNILNEIQNNPTLLQQWQTIVGGTNQNSEQIDVDWKCIDRPICDYTISSANLVNKYFGGVTINGTIYNIGIPLQINTANLVAIKTYLDNLALGVFNITISGGILNIVSLGNTNNVQSLLYGNVSNSITSSTLFNTPCKSTLNTIQYFINEVCEGGAIGKSCSTLAVIVTDKTQTGFTINVNTLAIGDTWQYSIDNGVTFINATSNPQIVTGLTSNQPISLVTKRICIGGGTSSSTVQTFNTISNTATCNVPSFAINGATSNSFGISITNQIAGDTYDVSIDGGVTWGTSINTLESVIITLPNANTAYTINVRHRCANNVLTLGTPINVTTLTSTIPCSIPIWSVTNMQPTSLSLNIGNFVVGDTYVINYNGQQLTTNNANATISGLTNGGTYSVSITHICANGNQTSAVQTITITNAQCQITGISVVVSGNSATISWNPIGGGTTAYTINYRVVGTLTWNSGTGGLSPRMIANLLLNTNYEFQIIPANGTCANAPQTSITQFVTDSTVNGYGCSLSACTTPPVLTSGVWTDCDGLSFCVTGTNTLTNSVYIVGLNISVGDTIYSNSTFTTPKTGFSYIRLYPYSQIWKVNPLTGQIISLVGNC